METENLANLFRFFFFKFFFKVCPVYPKYILPIVLGNLCTEKRYMKVKKIKILNEWDRKKHKKESIHSLPVKWSETWSWISRHYNQQVCLYSSKGFFCLGRKFQIFFPSAYMLKKKKKNIFFIFKILVQVPANSQLWDY